MVLVLTQKQTYRSTEQKRKPRNKPMHPDKGDNTTQWGKDSLLINGAGKTGQLHVKELQHYLIPYTKINSKWIKDLDVRPDPIKLLEES